MLSLVNVNKIASSSKRIESLPLEPDFETSIGARTMSIGGPVSDYGTLSPVSGKMKRNFFLNDIWQVALFNIVVAQKLMD